MKNVKKSVTEVLKDGQIVFSLIFMVLVLVSFGSRYLGKLGMPEGLSHLMVVPVNAHEIGEELICPCCGDLVADCECGMAEDRKEFIGSLIENGETKLDIFTKYVKEYDISEFKEKDLADSITEYLVSTAPDDRPIIEVSEEIKYLEDLIQSDYAEGERLEIKYEIKNTGSEDLIIDGIDTSCMCTTAQIVIDGQSSPEVGMDHGEEREEWKVIIKPGDTAEVKVYYDPNAHGEFSGSVVRTVTFKSNDPIQPKIQARFELEQI